MVLNPFEKHQISTIHDFFPTVVFVLEAPEYAKNQLGQNQGIFGKKQIAIKPYTDAVNYWKIVFFHRMQGVLFNSKSFKGS